MEISNPIKDPKFINKVILKLEDIYSLVLLKNAKRYLDTEIDNTS